MKASIVERFNRTEEWSVEDVYAQWKLQMDRPIIVSRVELECSKASNDWHATRWRNPRDRLLTTVYSAIKIVGPAKFKVNDSICVNKYKMVFGKGLHAKLDHRGV